MKYERADETRKTPAKVCKTSRIEKPIRDWEEITVLCSSTLSV